MKMRMEMGMEEFGVRALALSLIAFAVGVGLLFSVPEMLCGLAFLLFMIGIFGISLGIVKMGFEFYIVTRWGKGGKG